MIIARLRRGDGSTERLSFDQPEISIGREEQNDIVIPEGSVSKAHALIARTTKGVIVTDLESTNGTKVNGSPITAPITLRQGDEIAIGTARIWIEPETVSVPRRTYDLGLDPDAEDTSNFPPLQRKPPMGEMPESREMVGPRLPMESHASLREGLGGALPVLHDDEVQHLTSGSDVDATGQSSTGRSRVSSDNEPTSENDRQALADGVAHVVNMTAKAVDMNPFSNGALPPPDEVKRLEGAMNAQLKKMTDVPASLARRIADAARRELLEVGPIGPWLEDAQVSEIHCVRHDMIEIVRNGRTFASGLGFTSEASLHRAVVRLAKASGHDWKKGELLVERRFLNGSRLVAILPPLVGSTALTIKKREPVLRTIEELVSAHVISDPMAAFLVRCMRSRTNVVVCGGLERAVVEVVAALAAAAPAAHRIAVVFDSNEVRVSGRRTRSFALPIAPAEERDLLRGVMLLGFEHTVLTSNSPRVAAQAVAAIGTGGAGVVVGLRARSLQRGLGLTTTELASGRSGMSSETATTLLANALEVGVEIDNPGDGPPRVVRISAIEPSAPGSDCGYSLRDLYLFDRASAVPSAYPTSAPPPPVAGSDVDE